MSSDDKLKQVAPAKDGEFQDDDEIVLAKDDQAKRNHKKKVAAYLDRYINNLPTFSPATKKIIELSNQLNAPPNEIVKAIRMDPVLTGKVLQVVNSAYFALIEKFTSLNRAVVHLGINTIKNLALSTAMIDVMSTKNRNMEIAVEPVWKHSLAAAVCAKSIAKANGEPKDTWEEFFIAGLLHDIGKIVQLQCFYGWSKYVDQMPLNKEREKFSMSHDEMGAKILRDWNFSDHLCEVIEQHHFPYSENKLPHYIHIANYWTYRLGMNNIRKSDSNDVIELPIPEFNPDSYAKIGLTEEQVSAALKDVNSEFEKAQAFLKVQKG